MADLYHPSIYKADSHVDSYWAASAGPEVEGWVPLSSDERCEVAVIGGGYTGMEAALHLARDDNIDVRILEAGSPGWGASDRNGGFVGSDSTKLGLSEMIAEFGETATRDYHRNGLEAIDLVRSLGEDEDIDFDPQGDGELGVAHTPARMEGMDGGARVWGDMLGRKVEVWSKQELAERGYHGPEAFGGYFTHAGFALHPMKHARGLAHACIQGGVGFHGHSEVTSWERDGNGHRLRTPGNTLTADKVVIATNGFTRDKLHPGVAGTLLPALSNIIVTREMTDEEVARHGWVTECPVWNTRTLVFYYRLIKGNRFLLGARAAKRNTEAATEEYRRWIIVRLHEMWPDWADIDLEYFWRGFVCLSAARVPHIGELQNDPGVWHAFGYHGGGVGWATFSGRSVARLIAGNEPGRQLALAGCPITFAPFSAAMDAALVPACRLPLVWPQGSMMTRFSMALAVCLLLSACKSTGAVDNRLSYRFQWLSYLGGDDIRELCELRSQDRLRLIYNADFNNETRTFDFVAQPGGAASLTSQRWSTAGTLVATGGSILDALEPQSANAAVTSDQMAGLVTALDASDFYGPPPVGMTLRSDDYFWSSVACLDGQFVVQAYPRDRLDRVAFTQTLEALDPIGRPLLPVVLKSLPPLNSVRPQGNRGRTQDGSELYYSAAVGEDSITARWLN